MKKLDTIGTVLNVVLGVLYCPLSVFCLFLQMASESTIDATNEVYIALVNIFCIVALIIPFLCVAGIVASVILRKKGHSILSFIIQFVPLLVFFLDLILSFIGGSVPAII